MTKYILHGGEAGKPCESNDKYFREIINSVGDPARILLIYFAVDEGRWEELAAFHRQRFLDQAGNKKIEFSVASLIPEEFVRQVKDNEALFIRGGETPKLQRILEQISNFKELSSNKVVAGSSAGAIVFSKYYYDQDHDQLFDGLNYLPVKMFTHYKSTGQYAATSGEDKLKMLEDYKEQLPVYAIRETEFVVVNK